MLILCPIFDRIDLLPFYIRHYERLGATWFLFSIFSGMHTEDVVRCANQHVTTRWAATCGPGCGRHEYDSTREAEYLNVLRTTDSVKGEKWYCLADLDEFLYLGGHSLHDMALLCDTLGCDGLWSTLVDRVAPSGFPAVPPYSITYPALEDVFSHQCDISKQAGANCKKVSIARIDQPISAGNHTIPGRIHNVGNENHHFKWTAGIEDRLRDKHQRMTALDKPWAGELAHELELIESRKYATDECGFRPARVIGV